MMTAQVVLLDMYKCPVLPICRCCAKMTCACGSAQSRRDAFQGARSKQNMAAHAQHPLEQAESQGRGQGTYVCLSFQSTGQMVMVGPNDL